MRVLLVDDDHLVRRALARLFRLRKSAEVSEASDGLEALSSIRDGLRPDLIVSDQDMPSCSGTELHEKLKTEFPDIAGRMLIMSGGERARPYCTSNGVAYLDKPATNDQIIAVVDKLVR